ncbi:hypothetical protein CAAN1_23S02168 [[Candida] anglica]|uniref:Uncharacterized protein n=1 Tax=[Candida] anglica TaxID=148631 RepID=A0ABP0E9N4_9ASCO
MGSCVSVPKEDSSNVTKASSSGRYTKTNQKLGSSQPLRESPNVGSNSVSGGGKRLGASTETDGSISAREAVARAAEERYSKHQANLQSSSQKLKTMAGKSREEKGL